MDDETKCPPDGRLPDASKGPPHIRDIFYRMGFNDQEIVALSGAHALGRWGALHGHHACCTWVLYSGCGSLLVIWHVSTAQLHVLSLQTPRLSWCAYILHAC